MRGRCLVVNPSEEVEMIDLEWSISSEEELPPGRSRRFGWLLVSKDISRRGRVEEEIPEEEPRRKNPETNPRGKFQKQIQRKSWENYPNEAEVRVYPEVFLTK
jgi:hypothetical protein